MDSINNININGHQYVLTTSSFVNDKYVNLDGLKHFKEKLLDELSRRPLLNHKCNGCGAELTLDADKHIFHCPYCGSCYAIGTLQMRG